MGGVPACSAGALRLGRRFARVVKVGWGAMLAAASASGWWRGPAAPRLAAGLDRG